MEQVPVTEFILIPAKHDSAAEAAGPLKDAISSFKQAEGSQRVFSGRQLENPDIFVVAVVWSSLSASTAFATSPARPAIISTATAHRTVLSPADKTVAMLSAPTTEVFTGYGAEPGFEATVRKFASLLDADAPAGYHGGVVGPTAEDVSNGDRSVTGPAVKLVVGWDSKEAHVEAKEKTAVIQDNIHMLRSGQRGVDMWHAHLKE